jgi:hypothetical protein
MATDGRLLIVQQRVALLEARAPTVSRSRCRLSPWPRSARRPAAWNSFSRCCPGRHSSHPMRWFWLLLAALVNIAGLSSSANALIPAAVWTVLVLILPAQAIRPATAPATTRQRSTCWRSVALARTRAQSVRPNHGPLLWRRSPTGYPQTQWRLEFRPRKRSQQRAAARKIVRHRRLAWKIVQMAERVGVKPTIFNHSTSKKTESC